MASFVQHTSCKKDSYANCWILHSRVYTEICICDNLWKNGLSKNNLNRNLFCSIFKNKANEQRFFNTRQSSQSFEVAIVLFDQFKCWMNFQKISFDNFIPTSAAVSEVTFCCSGNIFFFQYERFGGWQPQRWLSKTLKRTNSVPDRLSSAHANETTQAAPAPESEMH